jgi:hypothetical protein
VHNVQQTEIIQKNSDCNMMWSFQNGEVKDNYFQTHVIFYFREYEQNH